MASFAVPIANAVKTIVTALTGAPSLVQVSKTDVIHPRDITSAFAAVIITMGDEIEIGSVSGAGTSTDQGDVLKSYQIGITIYGTNFGNISTDLSSHPDFVLACKQALNKTTLSGVPSVYGSRLVSNSEWESTAFGDGNEMSVFGMVFWNAETRLGN